MPAFIVGQGIIETADVDRWHEGRDTLSRERLQYHVSVMLSAVALLLMQAARLAAYA